ncbi:MAG: aminotransferase class V-fold PLP-dependent enzyme [Methylococcaceae bacterium]|nr:aminotransferase class V-fold PLP-dependent enzyme [Methylococcaceae bacterium]MDP3391895.1 aminotransferase class V-fold PLP-dependent enzyme [Methylococcaceae bacterium]MDP3932058.1 aminotransferase class V-fold PLP-dependent enzyme [Methylococcaceae bacterium]MDZ4155666.1 aminotransferase class V-fold PLP-dependent enzyme [Methylococcales bacterium]
MAGRNHLFIPGPTNVPHEVLSAMHIPMEDHRSPIFPKLLTPLLQDLKKVFKTETGQAFIFPATGTAGWEVALTNTLNPGDKVLIYRFGQFSHLWAEMAKRLGFDVEIHQETWGKGIPLDKIEARLKEDTKHEIKAVLATHNETATGVTSDIGGVRKALNAANHPAMLFVDGVSSIASLDFRMDEWGVDAAISGSQKGFMLPAGGAFLAFSQKALQAAETNTYPRCFLDLRDQANANKDGYTPYTPNLPLLYGLRKSLDLLLEEGLENVYARHFRLAEGVRKAVAAWGLTQCAQPGFESNTVTAIVVPEGKDAKTVISIAFNKYNISLGAGLSEVAGKVFRIGHVGDMNDVSLLGAIAGVEMALLDSGIDIKPGSGVAAAIEYYRATAK